MIDCSILLYHGIHADDLDLGLMNSSGKHISRARFDAEMAWLSQHRPMVSMLDIAAASHGGAPLPEGAVAVTFDDGFLNNFDQAWPVLERYGVPATIYIATGYIGTGRMIWTDRLEALMLRTTKSQLEFDGEVWSLATGKDRVMSLTGIKRRLKGVGHSQKEAHLDEIEAALGLTVGPDHALHAFMTWDDVRQMAKSPLIDFGAHTVDHVSLARVPEPEMQQQIRNSVAKLEQELQAPCDLFSYPEGQAGDYNDAVIAFLKAEGFNHSPTAIDGINHIPGTDPFHLKRFMVGFENRPFPLQASGTIS